MSMLAVGGLAFGGFWYVRWKLAQQRLSGGGWKPGPGALWGRRKKRMPKEQPQVVYLVEEPAGAGVPLSLDDDWAEWGFQE
jgi:hypothetical protein